MKGKVGKLDPYKDRLGDIFFGVERKVPFVEMHASWTHEVWSISENEIPIFFFLKNEDKIPFTTENLLHFSLEEGSPIFTEPDFH